MAWASTAVVRISPTTDNKILCEGQMFITKDEVAYAI